MGSGELQKVLARIDLAKGRSSNLVNVTVVAVSKTRAAQEVAQLAQSGQLLFGENRVQELIQKQDALSTMLAPEVLRSLRWHLIGTLQRNKVRKVVGRVDLIQSVDSCGLAKYIDSAARELGIVQPVLIQVNCSGEASKSGSAPDAFLENAQKISGLTNLRVEGIMTIGPLTEDRKAVASCFRRTKELFDQARALVRDPETWRTISMGMTDDLEIAIEEGSNMVRIGRAIFGDRG